MDAHISPSGLFGDAVNSVVKRLQESATFYIPETAILRSPGLLNGSSPKHIKPAPHTMPHRNRAWLVVLPHLESGDTGNIQDIFPPKVERSTPYFMLSVSLRCPQGTVLPTLPLHVLQGAAVSGERISHGPPKNVVALKCPPPPRRVSERSVQMLPAGLQFKDVFLTAQLHINRERGWYL